MHAEVFETTTSFTAATWGSTCQAARSGTDPLRTHKWQLGKLAAVGTAVRISARTAMLIGQLTHPNKSRAENPCTAPGTAGTGHRTMGSHFDYPLLHTVLQCLRGHGREVSCTPIGWPPGLELLRRVKKCELADRKGRIATQAPWAAPRRLYPFAQRCHHSKAIRLQHCHTLRFLLERGAQQGACGEGGQPGPRRPVMREHSATLLAFHAHCCGPAPHAPRCYCTHARLPLSDTRPNRQQRLREVIHGWSMQRSAKSLCFSGI